MDAGHVFLAKLGKKRLRPGGIEASEWLISKAQVKPEHRVLEIACNNGSSMIELAKRFSCHITGVDIDPRVIEVARANIDEENLNELISVQRANAINLPFPDESFDLIFNEAMLTMFNSDLKQKAVKEYFRVLKPGGKLLTQDICISEKLDQGRFKRLREILKIQVEPLSKDKWLELFTEAGFTEPSYNLGEVDFLILKGLMRDEGKANTLAILWKALSSGKLRRFIEIKSFFQKNRKEFKYIVVASHKESARR